MKYLYDEKERRLVILDENRLPLGIVTGMHAERMARHLSELSQEDPQGVLRSFYMMGIIDGSFATLCSSMALVEPSGTEEAGVRPEA